MITESEFVEMLNTWEQCCSDIGEGWKIASKRLNELEEKAGISMPLNYSDFEGFHIAVLTAIHRIQN